MKIMQKIDTRAARAFIIEALARPACSLVVLLLSSGCPSFPSLNHELHPENRDYQCLQYDNYQQMRCEGKSRGLSIEMSILRKEELRATMQLLYDRETSQRAPDLMPIRLHVRNLRESAIFADFYRFRIRNAQTGKIYPVIGPVEYYEKHYGRGLAILDFYWAFEQKDPFRFLQPLPDWLLARKSVTASPAERKRGRDKRLQDVLAGHAGRAVVPAGQELKGFLLFEELPSGASYVLEYVPGEVEKLDKDAPAREIGEIAFPPFHFRQQLTRSGEMVEVDPKHPEKLDDKKAEMLEERELEELERDRKMLYIMHSQFHRHFKLVNKGKK